MNYEGVTRILWKKSSCFTLLSWGVRVSLNLSIRLIGAKGGGGGGEKGNPKLTSSPPPPSPSVKSQVKSNFFYNISAKDFGCLCIQTNWYSWFCVNGSWFQGCVALLRYSSTKRPFENVKLIKSRLVWGNCSGEACSSKLNMCQHGGQCVDLVTKTECDCKETGYYGRHCELSGKHFIYASWFSTCILHTIAFNTSAEW